MFMHRGEGIGRGRKGRGPIRRLTESYMDGSFAKIFEVYLENNVSAVHKCAIL